MINQITINGISIPVNIIRCNVRNCYLKFNEGIITIKIPKRLPENDAKEITNKLCARFSARVLKDPKLITQNTVYFKDGDITSPLGINLNVSILNSENKNPSAIVKKHCNSILVKLPKSLNETDIKSTSNRMVFLGISKYLLPTIKSRINVINNTYFRSEINDIRLRYKETSWGSYSKMTKRITINTKLLYLPNDVINYVLVHELAHTKVSNHSKMFWDIVYSIIPEYKIHRRYLRNNGSSINFISNSTKNTNTN